jgi:BirA family biotin operon repressor/biotin-[acetyl-CoA-carboxylase] ligase
MLLIKLDATDSTNAYLKDLLVGQNPPDGTVVQADWQKKGRGQLGRDWFSEPGKNLTISVLKRFDRLNVSDQFILSIISSLAVAEVLQQYQVPHVQVKWPNDILSGKQKICGILVENVVKGAFVNAAVIGIGLNVNQDKFPDGLNATSIKLLTGREMPLDGILRDLRDALDQQFSSYLYRPYEWARKAYEEVLFMKDKAVEFSTAKGEILSGTLLGVDASGRLMLENDSGITEAYGFNEIRMIL